MAAGLARNRALRSLDLDKNDSIGPEAAAALIDAFPAEHPIEILYLSACNIGDMGAAAVGRLAGRGKRLRFVSVRIDKITLVGLGKILEGVEASRSIEALHVGGNIVGLDGAKCIAATIPKWESLRELQIHPLGMGPEGAWIIAQAIAQRRWNEDIPKRIYASRSDCGEEGEKALKEAAKNTGFTMDIW